MSTPDPDLTLHFRRRLRALRRVQELSQAALGARVGLSQSAVAKIESGSRDVSLSEAAALAEALGTDLTDLLRNVRSVELRLPREEDPDA